LVDGDAIERLMKKLQVVIKAQRTLFIAVDSLGRFLNPGGVVRSFILFYGFFLLLVFCMGENARMIR